MKKVFIVSASRTAIGSFGGSLASLSPSEIGAYSAKETIARAYPTSPDASKIDHVIVGNVLGAGHGMNIARQVALASQVPQISSAYTVNMVCGSGLKAVINGCHEIQSGQASVVLAGGTESMTQAGFISLQSRWGSRLGHQEFKDLILQDGLSDYFCKYHMGITAENLAEKYTISRADQDNYAFSSQQRAAKAQSDGLFKDEIVPVPLFKKGKQVSTFEHDEFIKTDSTIEALSKLSPAFKPSGTVTAGNASGINDGAAMVLLASEEAVTRDSLKPMAEIVGYATAGCAPEIMGIGPVGAVKRLCEITKIDLEKIDSIEANEAFAAQALAVTKELQWDTSKVNTLGGAIALGHPIGASGARVLVTLLYRLIHQKQQLGLATLCIGGGQGIAMLIRRV